MKVISNPFNLEILTVSQAKQLCKDNGFRSIINKTGYQSDKRITVEPMGKDKDLFINELINQKYYILNGGILCNTKI